MPQWIGVSTNKIRVRGFGILGRLRESNASVHKRISQQNSGNGTHYYFFSVPENRSAVLQCIDVSVRKVRVRYFGEIEHGEENPFLVPTYLGSRALPQCIEGSASEVRAWTEDHYFFSISILGQRCFSAWVFQPAKFGLGILRSAQNAF